MKNKETLIGWLLIAVLMTGFIFYQNKKLEEEQLLKKSQPKTEQSDKNTTPAAPTPVITNRESSVDSSNVSEAVIDNDSLRKESKFGLFAAAASGEERIFVLENEVFKITLTNKGGQIKSAELKQYKTSKGEPLVLFTDRSNSLSYQFAIDENRVIDTRDFYFEPVGEEFNLSGKASRTFALRLPAGEGKYIEQKYTLTGNSYLIDYQVSINGLNDVIPSNTTFINAQWENTLRSLEQNIELERRYSALYYRYNQSDVAHLNEDNETDEAVFDAPLEWISYKQQFFNTTLFSKGEFQRGKLKTNFNKEHTDYVKKYEARFTLPYNPKGATVYDLKYYIGPNHFNTLSAMNQEVEEIIKLGPDFWMFSWIRYITRFIIWVFSWFDSVHLNYGIIILLMTLILKIAMHPLTAKSIESAAKMKILSPEIAALKEKYGDDQSKLGPEQMKLYQRAGVSPFGGCLPLLLQMPILMAMYYFFPASIELRQQPFLWATDLSTYDAIVTFSTSIPLIGQHISLFTILMTITSVGQAVMNNQMNAMANQQPGMKYMPYFMPILLMFMFNSFPAALTYYYLLQNLLGMGHQWIIQKFFIDEEKLRAKIEENKKNPKPASSWQKKIEQMQRDAQQKGKTKNKK